MPELAEVEFFRQRWSAGEGSRVSGVLLHPGARVFREGDPALLHKSLRGARLTGSQSAAKQMLFHFSGNAWLGIHLGMSGELRVDGPHHVPGRHEHLVLVQKERSLVFSDPRMFGRVRLSIGKTPPAWWTDLAPPVLSAAFTRDAVADFFQRHPRIPVKAVLLSQERFPGIGNWMADEILWRAGIHPRQPAGSLDAAQIRVLWRECRNVCRMALDKIAGGNGQPPPDLNVNIPDSWLFNHRWAAGGRCPRTGVRLERAAIGGRTTCWSPARQKLR